uniref:FecR domain-containing protein n=1 Tax=Roseihalotalea indica TaxID=2867963 RepID=A0AA49JIY8_9BACT|nr:FecR domain-containing protein [Tunicatimonas sp. TK19036]
MRQPKLTLGNLLNNEDFIAWVSHSSPEQDQYWQQYIIKHPEHAAIIAQARDVLLALQSDEDQLTVFEKQALQHKLTQHLRKEPVERHGMKRDPIERSITNAHLPRPKAHYSYWIAASVALFLLLLGGIVWVNESQEKIMSTGYGETATLELPDGSLVVLNANSQIRYSQAWEDREVWLEGEAYFHVQKQIDPVTADSAKFTVHTDNLTVMVLGTKFNVNSRQAQVVLDDGKVHVRQNDADPAEVDLRPGEMVELDRQTAQLVKREVNPYHYIAWKDNMLILDETPLGEIARLLEERYGYSVIFETDALKQVSFVGTYPADDIEVLLRTLEISLNMVVEGKEIIIKE